MPYEVAGGADIWMKLLRLFPRCQGSHYIVSTKTFSRGEARGSIICRLFFRLKVRILAPKFLFSVVQSVGNSVKPRIRAVAETLKVFLRHPIVIVGEIAQSDLFGDIVHVLFGEAVDDIFLLVSHRSIQMMSLRFPSAQMIRGICRTVCPACILALNTKYPSAFRRGERSGSG